MLNDLLGWIVALGSLGLYLSRFFLPEVQRKNDAIWSGVGLFYALILWANGDRIKGGLLLGQMASVALIVWLGWQALQQRRQLAASQNQTPLPESVQSSWPFVKTGLDRLVSTIKDGPASSPEIAQGSGSEKKEFKIGGLTLPFDLSALLATVKGSPSREATEIPKASPADGKDDDWGDEVVSEPSTPKEPEPKPVAEVTNESQVTEVIEETVEAVATETVIPEVAIAPNEPEPSVETSDVEEPSVQFDVSTEISVAEVIPEPEPVNSDVSPEQTEESTAEAKEVADISAEVDQNQPSNEANLAQDYSTPETMEVSHQTPDENVLEDVAHEDAAHTSAPENDDGSWPPEDPVT
jgi:Ycf66 protein N-terminus